MTDQAVKFTLSAYNKTQDAFASVFAAFNSLKDKAASINGILGGIGAGVSVAGIVALGKSIIDAGDEMNDLSQRVGISVADLAKYKLATDQSGTSMEALAKGIKGMASNLVEHGDALKALGLNTESADQSIMQLADVFAAMPDGIEKTELATKLFGKAGMDLIPMLNLGSAGLKEAAEKSEKFAVQMASMAPLADKFNDNLSEIALNSKVLGMTLANEALPGLIRISSAMADAAKNGSALSVVMAGMGAWSDIRDEKLKQIYGLSQSAPNIRDVSGKISNDTPEAINGRAASRVKRQAGTPITDKPQWQVDYEALMAALGDNKDKKAGADKAAQEAAARLAAETSAIKKAGEIQAGVLASKERMLETLRSAGLVDERSYYAQKRELLTQSNAAQEAALQQEITRLQAENLTGKAKIDNDRKIADTQADLTKQRQTAATSVAVLGIQETAALNAITQGYRDAEDAAKAYLDTIRQAQARELSGMGLGNKERGRIDGRAQIEDKYSQQRQDLAKGRRDAELNGTFGPDAQAKYDDELERIKRFSATALTEYDAYYSQRTKQEGNWAIGANEALANYLAESHSIASQTEQVFTNAFHGMEDALVTFVTTGKLSFTNLANSIVADITRIIIKQQIANATVAMMGGSGGGMGLIGSLIGAVSGTSGVASAASAMSGNSLDNMMALTGAFGTRATGGSVSAGSVYQVNEKGPELLNVAGRQYLMMGNQGGSVTPNSQIGGGNTVHLTVNQQFAPGTTRATTLQAAADASRQLQYAGRNL